MSKLCALVIGHKKSSPGAVNESSGLTEFAFNDDLARSIEEKAVSARIQLIYRRTYAELPGDINALGPDFIVSLHCNALDKTASGTETLYHHRSSAGKVMAEILQKRLVAALGLRDRGVKPKTSEDRGGSLLKLTEAPCLIAEPFFIDNDIDLKEAQTKIDALAGAYAAAIDEISGAI